MKLTEMLGQYEELLDKKDQLAKDTKDNNAAIDKLKAEIAEMMIDEDIPSQGYGDYVYSLQDKPALTSSDRHPGNRYTGG